MGKLKERVVKPKTQRVKRALVKRDPKIIENPKTTLMIRAANASGLTMSCMKDLTKIKNHTVFFNKKNDVAPFEDTTSLEFFAEKNDASLFVVAQHNKKRPHNLVLGRLYDHHLLDMAEFGLENYKALQDFKVAKIPAGIKPLLLFAGDAFDHQPNFRTIRNLLIDFFHGEEIEAIRLAGLEHVLQFVVIENKIYMRSYKVLMKKSGTKIPRIELEEIGPSLELVLRRSMFASKDLNKVAFKQPKQAKVKKTKNIKKNPFGTKVAQIHMQKQDISKLQTRKMKGLKRLK